MNIDQRKFTFSSLKVELIGNHKTFSNGRVRVIVGTLLHILVVQRVRILATQTFLMDVQVFLLHTIVYLRLCRGQSHNNYSHVLIIQ